AVVHAVQPRLEVPPTTNLLTSIPPPAALRQKAVIASIARTTLLVIGSRSGQASSLVRRYLSQLYAMIASSERFCASSTKVRGWFGTMRSSAITELVKTAATAIRGFTRDGRLLSFEPPPMIRSPVSVVTCSGSTTVNQCFHSGRSTSASSRQR